MAETEGTLARLRQLALDCASSLGRAGRVRAPEDAAILDLCEKWGFGAVMDSACRQWLVRDPVGAFTVGPCAGTVRAVVLELDAQELAQKQMAYEARRARALAALDPPEDTPA